MIKELSILYIGSLDHGSNSFRRYKALLSLCPKTEAINTDPFILNKYFIRIQHHLNLGPGIILLNSKIRQRVSKRTYNIILVDNKPFLGSNTLRFIKRINPEIKIANLLTDDPFGKYSKSWRLLKKTAFLYDIIFVQREVNISELKNIGVGQVEICYRSYDPDFHRPLVLNQEENERYNASVGFIGTYEENREKYIVYLIQNGVGVSLTGDGWPNGKYWNLIEPYYRGPSVYGEEYIKTINGMDIALHFLRKGNRDEQDSRTFEIPACGVFMLAEESNVHTCIFKPGEEAVFFETKDELLETVRYYLINPEEREAIAKAGLLACTKNQYSHSGRLKGVISKILEV